MLTTLPPPGSEPDAAMAPQPRTLTAGRGLGDRTFFAGITASGTVVLAIMGGVGLFLTIQAWQALRAAGPSFLTTADWQIDRGHFGISGIMVGTVLIAVVAVCAAVPVALGAALFITEVAPLRLRSLLIALIDLMAAVPSVVYGLWGLFLLQGKVVPLSRWINTWLGWIPIFKVDGADPTSPLATDSVYTASAFVAGLVVAMMVTPIACVVMRQVLSQVPIGEREGAYALGSTRWGMIRVVALPFGRGGIIGGTMLGLGRALGETIAVVLIISPVFTINFHVLQVGTNSVSALIAARAPETGPGLSLSALFAAGLALFVITLAINFAASWFISRSRSGASSEA